MSAFFLQNITVFYPKSTFTKSNSLRVVLRDFLVLFSTFVRQKVTVTENIILQTLCPEFGLRSAPNWPKIRKMTMTSQFSDMTSTSKFFDVVLFVLSSLVTGRSFNIITGSGIMTIFYHKGLTRNPEIENTPVWALPNIWRLG